MAGSGVAEAVGMAGAVAMVGVTGAGAHPARRAAQATSMRARRMRVTACPPRLRLKWRYSSTRERARQSGSQRDGDARSGLSGAGSGQRRRGADQPAASATGSTAGSGRRARRSATMAASVAMV
jgi:hypothetical protein